VIGSQFPIIKPTGAFAVENVLHGFKQDFQPFLFRDEVDSGWRTINVSAEGRSHGLDARIIGEKYNYANQ
jgi:hypothetical protein